jgi:protein phosphatase inhibitor 2
MSKEVKGILKKKNEKKNGNVHAVWDEENLVETSIGRGTRMKIDQPDTPYAYPGDYSSYSEDDHSIDQEGDARKFESEKNKNLNRSEKKEVKIGDSSELFDKLQAQQKHQEEGNTLILNSQKDEEDKKSFAQKRKAHYQEGKAWKEMKAKGNLEEEDGNKK